jgi:two-component system, OmpR family, sensor histidine kinase TctE
LIDNALRYGRPSGRVSVIVEDGPQPKLAVQDDGPGIPEEERDRIFERFYRMEGSSGDGCGLGLAIVEEIARLHHSSVEIATGADGHGSRFTVVFPLAAHPLTPDGSVRPVRNPTLMDVVTGDR